MCAYCRYVAQATGPMCAAQLTFALLIFFCCNAFGRPIELYGAPALPGLRIDKQLYEELGSLATHNTIHVLQVSSFSLRDAELWLRQLSRHNATNFVLVTMDTPAQGWLQLRHPNHVYPISILLRLVIFDGTVKVKYAATFSTPCTRPLIISVLLAGGFDVIWIELDAVSQPIPLTAVPAVQPSGNIKGLQDTEPTGQDIGKSNGS